MISNWVSKLIPTTNNEELVPDGGTPDPESMEKYEIKKKIHKLESRRERVSQDIENKKERYRTLLEKGAKAAPSERQIFALRAKMEKFKTQILSLKRLKLVKDEMSWRTVLSKKEMSEMVQDMGGDFEPSVDVGISEEDFQQKVDETKADIQAGLSEVGALMSDTNLDVGNIDVELNEEHEMMNELAKGETEVDDVDISDMEISLEGEKAAEGGTNVTSTDIESEANEILEMAMDELGDVASDSMHDNGSNSTEGDRT